LRVSTDNPDSTYKLHNFVVLPEDKRIRIVGGRGTEGNCNADGYDFYTEGVTPTNYLMDWWPGNTDCIEGDPNEIVEYYQQFANVSADNWGTWRLEVTNTATATARDYFLTVNYTAAPTDAIPTVAVNATGDGLIITEAAWSAEVSFNKTAAVGGEIILDGAAAVDFGAGYNPPAAITCYKDTDGDLYSDGTSESVTACSTDYYESSALIATTGDCNDNDAAFNPGAAKTCSNGQYLDCSGACGGDISFTGSGTVSFSGATGTVGF